MYWKLLLAGILIFPSIIITDVVIVHKSKSTTPAFDFAKANYPNKKFKTISTPFWETNKKNNTVDTTALKQSNWYATVIKNIEASEYEIKKDDKTGMFVAPNREQQLRASFNYNIFILQPRSTEQDWELRMQLSGIYANKQLVARPEENDLPVIGSNKIVFNNDNFSTEYINSKEGVRQNFIINKEPAGNPEILNLKLETNKNWYINKVHDKELHFAKIEGDQLSKKITYNSLKVWDANNKELTAKFVVNKKHTAFEIEVNTVDAVYPVTIDPLSTGTAGTPDWIGDDADQPDAIFGVSVASAGDINGDGYSDVIIGAYLYDDAPYTDEGRAFVYHGSATGLSATPNSTPDDADQASSGFGRNVASAGDVNGDGYSDVIIGAYRYDGGLIDEGQAFVYHGSAGGLSALPNSTPDDADQSGANFGICVATAGDVNGDGYSDIIIGANLYDDGFSDEGMAFVYYGSSTGLGLNPVNTPDDADQADAYFGVSVASAGDINGDGYSDVIIGANAYNDGFTDEGRVYIYHGSAAGLPAAPNSIRDDANQASADFGISVASAGDVNGDGYSDVIIGAHRYDDGFADEGRAFVYHGSAAGLSATPNSTPDDADQATAFFGYSVAAAGDVNGDGFSDVIIGAYLYDDAPFSNEGRAFVYYGSSTGVSASPISTPDDTNQFNANFGYCVASAGDVNGDGYSDVIIGAQLFDDIANTDEGRAFVYHGSASGISTTIQSQLESNQSTSNMGYSVACAGDVNADGYSDVIVGAYRFDNGHNDEGAVFVYHGSANGISATIQAQLESDQADANMGYSVAGAGDVNGDGYGDIIVGAWLFDSGQTDEGVAFVYHGSPSGITSVIQTQLEFNQVNANMGCSVAGAGDVNGDGYGDVIVGVFNFSNGQTGEGAAFIYHGSSTGITTIIQTQLEGNQANARFGYSVASAGDVNGDGYSDVIVGAFNFTNNQNNEGAAFVYHGSSVGISTTIQAQLESNQNNAMMGLSVAGAGDVNGDGFSDVIAGAYNFTNGQTNEGVAFVYHGSIGGITNTIQAQLESNQASSFMGYSVSSAGDVNGDGYSDVIVGALNFTNGQSNEGAAFVYHGSTLGISTTIQAQFESNQAFAQMGVSVAGAGDVNGDGYSDVIVGIISFTNVQSNEGAAFVYLGNSPGNNKRNNLRLYNQDLVTPIQQLNVTEPNLFGAGLFSKSPLGRVKGKLVWEVKSESGKFSGNPITNSTSYLGKQPSFSDLGIAGTELKYNVQKVGSKSNKIRTRVEYDKVTAITGQVYGPWRYPAGYTMGAYGMNSVPLPVKLSSFNGSLIVDKVTLQWSSSDDENVATYQVQRSSDNRNFTAIGIVNSVHQNGKSYNFTDAHPLKGTSWYRLRITDEYRRINYSKTIFIKNSNDAVWVYPTILNKAENINLQFKNSFTGIVEIQLVNISGASVFKKSMTTNGTVLPVELPSLSSGVYFLSAMQNGEKIITQKIIIR